MASFTAQTSASLTARSGEPAWMGDRRAEAFARFASLPWPDPSVEQWRHTDIRGLDLERFELKGASWSISESGEAADVVRPLADAARTDEELVRAYVGQAGVSDFEAKFAALNAAFGGGFFVYVPRGAHIVQPVETTWQIVEPGAAIFPRTIIVVEEGASLTYVDRYSAPIGEADALCVAGVEIHARPGSNVSYLALQDWPLGVWHFGITRIVASRDATVRSLAATLGGKLSRSVTEAVLDGQGAHAEMLGLYVGDHTQHIDNRTLQLHRAPNTSSELYYKGALTGNSRAIYSGLVDIEKEALHADAQQANRNLLLSDGASADPSPFLEIKTSEVVRASHGVSVGRPDEQILFYLRSRGLDETDAQNLYVKGFFQEIIDRVSVPEIRAVLEAAVEDELSMEVG